MQCSFIVAIVLFSLAAAHAQTGGQVNGQTSNSGSVVASDPLSVPTSSLPSSPGLALAVGGAPTGSTTAATGTGVGTSAAASITAPASINPQSSLLLPGEASSTSPQTAKVTTRAAGTPSSTICPPPVPSTDGGSANLSEVFEAPGGC
jgi:hypothetical protein